MSKSNLKINGVPWDELEDDGLDTLAALLEEDLDN